MDELEELRSPCEQLSNSQLLFHLMSARGFHMPRGASSQ